MSITLVAPGLLALPADALRSHAALNALARLGEATVDADGIEVATLRALRLDAAVAPLVARGAGLDPGPDAWLCADPVALVAGLDDVRLVGRVDDLRAGEAETLRARLDRHFADDGLAFHAPRPDRWLVRVRGRPLPSTRALARAMQAPLRALLPAGDDGATWRRWLNEIQMLLHGDPVNASREARGAVPVSGLWPWGGGYATPVATAPAAVACAGRSGDLVRGIVHAADGRVDPLPARMPSSGMSQPFVAVAGRVDDARALEAFVANWLAPALERLSRGGSDALALVADGGAAAATWRLASPSRLARWRARWSRAVFEVPSGIVSAEATPRGERPVGTAESER